MTTPVDPRAVLPNQNQGAETPLNGGMMAVMMDAQGRAQAQWRDADYNLMAVTPIVGPPPDAGEVIN